MRKQTLKIRGRGGKVKTYVFDIELEEEEDGRWSAVIPALPGCAVWGSTREEALRALQDGAQIYVEDMLEAGEEIPTKDVESRPRPAIAINL